MNFNNLNNLDYSPEIYGKRITVTYIPATSSDEAMITRYGGYIFAVPAYLLKLKPALKIDGEVKLTGTVTTMGAEQTLSMRFTRPNNSAESAQKRLIAGTYYAVGIDFQDVNESVLGKRNANLISNIVSTTPDNDNLTGEHLYALAMTHFFSEDKLFKSGAKLFNVSYMRTLAEGIVSLPLEVEYVFSTPLSATPAGIEVDIALSKKVITARDGNEAKRKQFMSIAGLSGSYNEHDIFEKIDNFASVSSVRAIQVANSTGVPIYQINSTNIAQLLPLIQVDADVKTDIKNAVNAKKEVTVPERNIQINDWVGVGYIIKDPVTGAGAYMISGGLGGGRNTNILLEWEKFKQMYWIPGAFFAAMIDFMLGGNVAYGAELEMFERIPNESEIQNDIVSGAISCDSLGYFQVGQCTGLVYKAYKAAGIYLFGAVLQSEGGKYNDGLDIKWGISQKGRYQSEILYDLAMAQNYNGGIRKTNNNLWKGDIVFFRNTFDRNGDGDINNDGITHVGIVLEEPRPDGTVIFSHALSKKNGVLIDSKLNIVLKDDDHNSILRVDPRANAAQLFEGFGTIRDIKP